MRNIKVTPKSRNLKAVLVIFGLFILIIANSQNQYDSSTNRHIYAPQSQRIQDTIPETDTLDARAIHIQDSINARMIFIQDSIQARLKFIQDSILVRQKFIQDSIARRKRMHDSLVFLQKRLPILLDAFIKTQNELIIVKQTPINIIGDSMLSNYRYTDLPVSFDKPYRPWENTVSLTGSKVKIDADQKSELIKLLSLNDIFCIISYSTDKKIIILKRRGTFQNSRFGNFYKEPVDSVFLDNLGRISKIKSYTHFYKATTNYKKGAYLFLNKELVKQFEYSTSNQVAKYRVIKFCDRWYQRDPEKVCNISTYTINKTGTNYTILRSNEPKNVYSDGTFVYEFDKNSLKSVSFKNASGSENWINYIEFNEDEYVSRYVYKNQGKIKQTLLINYYLDNPKAKYKVETITCIFEDDKICYYQKNNMTGKSRTRDKFTGEWSSWK